MSVERLPIRKQAQGPSAAGLVYAILKAVWRVVLVEGLVLRIMPMGVGDGFGHFGVEMKMDVVQRAGGHHSPGLAEMFFQGKVIGNEIRLVDGFALEQSR